MKRFVPVFMAALLMLASCASLNDADRGELRRHHVSASLYERMADDHSLSIPDLLELSRKRVPDGLIIHYLENTRTVYSLRTQDVLRLRKGGVSDEVIDYLLRTAQFEAPSYYSYPFYDPYFVGYPGRVLFLEGRQHRHR